MKKVILLLFSPQGIFLRKGWNDTNKIFFGIYEKYKTYILINALLFLVLFCGCSEDADTSTSIPSTVTDFDGNVYHTVVIGKQVWMLENLNTTRYSNGDLIGTTTPPTLEINLESTPKYQWAYDGEVNNVATYGRLYTWHTISDKRGVCPTGWHVPSDTEWTMLTDPLGGELLAGDELKEAGTAHWASPNTSATNSSGFTALPAGKRGIDGTFNFVGVGCEMWSSTEESLIFGRSYSMGFMSEACLGTYSYKTDGLSCRCLRD